MVLDDNVAPAKTAGKDRSIHISKTMRMSMMGTATASSDKFTMVLSTTMTVKTTVGRRSIVMSVQLHQFPLSVSEKARFNQLAKNPATTPERE